jgi:hypothetical protein
MQPMMPTANTLNRFGLGARPDETPPADPQRWLLAQFERYESLPEPWKPLSRTPKLTEVWLTQQRAARLAPEGQRAGIRAAYLRQGRDEYVAAVGARANSALQTPAPFVERLVHFWSNHFAVSVDKLLVVGLAGGFEADAIRPNVLGRFEDMLLAVVRHPAMLLYLDQAQSIGPDSLAGRRRTERAGQQRRAGLNENLAREIMELHTLGVRSGYTQADVTEFARALTGWTLPADESKDDAAVAQQATFRFSSALHEPGARTVLGRTYAEGGEEQARAILHDLVISPATARHIAFKLARHFRRGRAAACARTAPCRYLHPHQRRSAQRVSRTRLGTGGATAYAGEIQDAVGVEHICAARTRPSGRDCAANYQPHESARSTGMAARLTGGL